jgi:threonine/homoserine/homoserine lactone efflux protein
MIFEDITPAFLDLAFVRGCLVGFALAAPIGPVAVLCIRRALARGFTQAVIAGVGAAFADMFIGATAGLSLTIISTFVLDNQIFIGLVGGLLVLGLGITTYRAPVQLTNGAIVVKSLRRDFVTAFSIAITNPATMIAGAGVFAAFGPIDIYTAPVTAFWLVTGVFMGSVVWWVFLSGAVTALRARFVNVGLSWLNRISGSIIAILGVIVLAATALSLIKSEL